MPLTPFIGLSVLIHISIIVINKLLRRVPGENETTPIVKNSTRKSIAYASLIIASVFTFVFINAGILIRASLTDSHSTVRFVNNYFNDEDHLPLAFAEQKNEVVETPAESCPRVRAYLLNTYDGSLSKYLVSKGKDGAFPARSALASTYGINKYNGTTMQNHELLTKVFLQDDKTLAESICKENIVQ